LVWAEVAAFMTLLLDTQVFLWWNEASPRLSRNIYGLLSEPDNRVLLSVVSAWEIVLKVYAGKLKLPTPVAAYLPSRLAHYRIEVLPLGLPHVLAAEMLAPHHRDPFDRMLIAQAHVDGLPIATRDPQIRKYGCETIW
jgi:PIN domain nuclease of toxin-antitoxin system